MKAIELTAPSLTAFRRTELPDPVAGPGQVLLRLHAASLNFVDLALATGNFPGASFPMIPVTDGAGEIAALGNGVHGLAVGARVIPHFMPGWQSGPIAPGKVAAMRGITLPGSLAEYVAVPAASVVAPTSRLGDCTARRNAASSSGLAIRRSHDSASFTSPRSRNAVPPLR